MHSPDWMTSSRVAPMAVLRDFSLSKTSCVRYFFSSEWHSLESCRRLKPAFSLSRVAWSVIFRWLKWVVVNGWKGRRRWSNYD